MINTTLCYIERGGQYLMLHRVKKKNDINHDKWIGIGGKFEARESPEDCLLREAREETGLTLTSWRYRGIVTFVAGPDAEAEYMHLFTADGFEGTLKTCDEGDLLFDDIGSELKIREIQRTRQTLLESLETYYKVFFLGEKLEEV